MQNWFEKLSILLPDKESHMNYLMRTTLPPDFDQSKSENQNNYFSLIKEDGKGIYSQ